MRASADFPGGRYSRGHPISFDGGTTIPASASPHVVGRWAVEEAVDPEEMLVAALASCHMLWFLHVALLAGFTVTACRDCAEGVRGDCARSSGRYAGSRCTAIEWAGPAPDIARLDQMHHEAHEVCYIANSVRTEVTVAPAR